MNNKFVKADIAIEILAKLIADTLRILENETDEVMIKFLKNKLNKYMEQRMEVYAGNNDTIEYVINVYGKELKNRQ